MCMYACMWKNTHIHPHKPSLHHREVEEARQRAAEEAAAAIERRRRDKRAMLPAEPVMGAEGGCTVRYVVVCTVCVYEDGVFYHAHPVCAPTRPSLHPLSLTHALSPPVYVFLMALMQLVASLPPHPCV